MDYKRILLVIFLMALVTYLPRALPMAVFRRPIGNRFVKSLLNYLPYGILAAMIFPEVLYSTASMISAAVGFVVAALMSYKKLGLLPVALGATLAVYLCELALKAGGVL